MACLNVGSGCVIVGVMLCVMAVLSVSRSFVLSSLSSLRGVPSLPKVSAVAVKTLGSLFVVKMYIKESMASKLSI